MVQSAMNKIRSGKWDKCFKGYVICQRKPLCGGCVWGES